MGLLQDILYGSNNFFKDVNDSHFLRGLQDTLAFGAMPKAGGGLGAIIARQIRPDLFENESFGETYAKGRDYLRNENKKAAEESPWAYGLGGLAGGVLNPIGRGVNSIKGAAGAGAMYGGLYGLGSSDTGTPLEFEAENLLDAAKGAGIGAGTSGLLQAGIKGGGNLYNRLKPLGSKNREALALSEKFNVPISLGQASQNTSQQLAEDILSGGARGSDAAGILNAFKDQQQNAFQEAVRSTRKQVGGGHFTEKGASLKPATNKIIGTYNNEKQVANKAYDLAKEEVGFLKNKDVKKFSKFAKAKLAEEALAPENAPVTYAQLKAFDRIFNKAPKGAIGVDFKRIEAYRQGLNRAYQASSGQDTAGIKIIIDLFDDHVANIMERALIEGNSNILEQFKHARGLFSDLKSKYFANHETEFGKKFIQWLIENAEKSREPLTNAMISDRIFGANKYGFNKEAESIVKEIKNHIGENSPEFEGLKLDAAQKVLKPLLGNKGKINFNNPAVQTFKNNLSENKTFLKTILNDKDIKDLEDLGDLGSLLYQSRKSVVNPTGSGIATLLAKSPLLQGILKVPYIKELGEIAQNMGGANLAKKSIDQEQLEKNLRHGLEFKTLENPSKSSALGSNSLIDALKRPSEEINGESINDSELDNLSESELQELLQSREDGDNDLNSLSEEQLVLLLNEREMSELPTPEQSSEVQSLSQPEAPQMPQAPGQMPQQQMQPPLTGAERIEQTINNSAMELGLNPQFVRRIAEVESGLNPKAKAKTSSASGLFQFTNSTWRQMVKEYGGHLGIQMQDKNNPEANAIMGALHIRDNANGLKNALGRDPTSGEVYMAHFLGLGGAKSLLRNYGRGISAAKLFPKAAKANKGLFYAKGKPVTVEHLYRLLSRKINA